MHNLLRSGNRKMENSTVNLSALQIRFDLARRGYTQVRLAEELSVGRPAVSRVISGLDRSARIENRISELLGYCPFPESAWRRKHASN